VDNNSTTFASNGNWRIDGWRPGVVSHDLFEVTTIGNDGVMTNHWRSGNHECYVESGSSAQFALMLGMSPDLGVVYGSDMATAVDDLYLNLCFMMRMGDILVVMPDEVQVYSLDVGGVARPLSSSGNGN
jgi:hypothetical protein